ncbi:MAG: malonyl-CoA decarboxylase [Burkholderiales bacterium]|nr:malonyl-CoA decarboxylase [Burkholderiales bacterium]
MDTPSFLKRIIRLVIRPDEQARAQRMARHMIDLCHALLSERGEVSGAALARETLIAYHSLPEPALPALFDLLSSEFSPDPIELARACQEYCAQPSTDTLISLFELAEPPRQELFRRLNTAPGGTTTLVGMRALLLRSLQAHPQWKGIDADLEHLFGSWFNRGFLSLQRIDWNTPAIILEKLIKYEAVHEISGWRDLHRRLEDDRRCFAFFHPALPNEPLIFIEVALTKGISDAVQPLLNLDSPVTDPQTADTAIFYSITNCQRGLRGISFGNLLIKQVAQELGREFSKISTFATLSPVPGFRTWLAGIPEELAATAAGRAAAEAFKCLDDPDWFKQKHTAERVQKHLMPLCACYLIHAKNKDEPADSVARFHLGNGARLERLNWLADTSKRGMQRAAGLMVNYQYRLDDVADNHEVYVKEHRVVASTALRKLARECPLSLPDKR